MSAVIQPHVVDVGGARIQYLDAGQGKPVVFFHGAGGVDGNAAFVSMLADSGYRTLVPSRPGFDSSTGDPQTVQDVAEIMAAFIRQVAGGPVHLLAESAGGAPACWLAILHPDLVSTLVLAAPAAFMRHSPPAGPPPSPGDIERRLFGDNPGWLAPPTPEAIERRRRNSAFNMGRWLSPDANADLLERLPEIKAPTLVLWGSADQIIPPEQGEIYQKHILGALLMYIYGAAHALSVSAAQKFVELSTDFIERGEAFVVNTRGA